MDAHHVAEQNRIIKNAEYAAAVLARGTDILLVFLDTPMSDELKADAAQRGLAFHGVMAYMPDGECVCKSEPGLDSLAAMVHAGFTFAWEVGKRVKARHGDSVEFLQKLFDLPDNRTEAN